MDVFLMYVLMIVDLTWTLMHHEQVGELNPLFSRLLMANEVEFVYLKLAANSLAVLIVIYLRQRKPVVGHILAVFGIIIYGIVVWLHWFVDHSFAHAEEVTRSALWDLMHTP